MLLRLILLLTVTPAVELVLLLQVHHAIALHWGSSIGLLVTLGAIVATGIAGAALARYQGRGVLRNVQQSLRHGELPAPALTDGMLVLLGAALLLTPGFLTDAFGLTLLLPGTRPLYRKLLLGWLRRNIRRGEIHVEARAYGAATNNDRDEGDTGEPDTVIRLPQ